ncbi:hypothetical protein [Micromonospora sp. NPDC049679]|uniref:hypothetical protein n=1 Tax=Micromonospora sp. NPDC049679 TaxID=3155920 RepID=UPI0033C6743A
MRPRAMMSIAIAMIALGALLLVPAGYRKVTGDNAVGLFGGSGGTGGSGNGAKWNAWRTLTPRTVDLPADGFSSWALLNRATGEISGSPNLAATSTAESMIKVWIVADHLRRTTEQGTQPTPDDLTLASRAIRDSDDLAAQELYAASGKDAGVTRMIRMCGLTDTRLFTVETGWWALTQISARDAVRMGECVKNGTAAGPRWTTWVLNEMTEVRGTVAPADQHETSGGGRWGIVDGLPDELVEQGPIGMKNGWTVAKSEQQWHVNCLAVADDWALAVLLRYDERKGLGYGATTCADVAAQLAAPKA